MRVYIDILGDYYYEISDIIGLVFYLNDMKYVYLIRGIISYDDGYIYDYYFIILVEDLVNVLEESKY